jgi:hypothetical protein
MDRFFLSLGAAFFVCIQIDAGSTSLAAMGSTKLSVLASLREAWNAVPDEVRRERFKVLSENQTKPMKVVQEAVSKGLICQEEKSVPGTRNDWRSESTRVANSNSNNDQGRQLKRLNTDEELERAEKRMKVAAMCRDAARLQLESRSLEIQAKEAPAATAAKEAPAATAGSSQHQLANVLHAPVLPAPKALDAHGAAVSSWAAQALQERDALLQGEAKPPVLVTN